MYANRKPTQGPPCQTCFIKPAEANEDALFLFGLVRWQTVTTTMGESTLTDLDINAVNSAMNIYQIKNKPACLSKLIILFRNFWGQNAG